MIVLGVDPGASGAIAVLGGGRGDLLDMPVGKILVGKTSRNRIIPELLAHELRSLLPVDVAYVEEVAGMPKQGISSTFTFGQAHGLVLGALAALQVRTIRIRPQVWQKVARGRGDPRPRALELYPHFAGQLSLKKHEGRADAILIAHAGLEMERRMKWVRN